MKTILLLYRRALFAVFILVAASCAGVSPAAVQDKPGPETTPALAPVSSSPIPSALASPTRPPAALQPTRVVSSHAGQDGACSPAHLPESVMLVTWDYRTQANQIAPVDPVIGLPLCGFEPIRAGKQFFTAQSPDGNTLALTISKRDDGGAARLYLLNLEKWQLVETPVEFERWIGLLAFSPDGRHLAVASFGPAYGAQGMLMSTQLSLVNLLEQTVTAETLLDFNPRLLKYTADGSALVLYGGKQDQEYLAIGEPVAVMLDARTLNQVWGTTLPGILEGAYADNDIEGPEGQTNWVPGAVFSPRSQELYLANADSDRLTKVDFANHSLGTIDIYRASSWLERLLAWTAGVAHAKIFNGTTKTAVLSPGEERLYLFGMTGDSWQDENSEWHFEEQVHDLQVVDPANGAEIARLEVESSDLALSQDGTQIFLRGWNNTAPWTEVVYAASLKPVERLRGRYLVSARKLNGEPILLSNVSHENQTSLSWIDASTFNELLHWRVRGYASWLIMP